MQSLLSKPNRLVCCLLAALLFIFAIICLTGCTALEKGDSTIKMFNGNGDLVETVEATAVGVVDEENRVVFVGKDGKKRSFVGSFEVYDAQTP